MLDRDLQPEPGELGQEPKPNEALAPGQLETAAVQGMQQAREQLRSVNEQLRDLGPAQPGSATDQRAALEAQAADLKDLVSGFQTASSLLRDIQGGDRLDGARLEAAKNSLVDLEHGQPPPSGQEFLRNIASEMTSAIDQVRDAASAIARVPGVDQDATLDDLTRIVAQELADPSVLERAAGNILDPNTMFAILEMQQQVYDMELEAMRADQEFRRSLENAPDNLASHALILDRIDGLNPEIDRMNKLRALGQQLMRDQVSSAMRNAAKGMRALVEELAPDLQEEVFRELARVREERKRTDKELRFLEELEARLIDIKTRVGYYE